MAQPVRILFIAAPILLSVVGGICVFLGWRNANVALKGLGFSWLRMGLFLCGLILLLNFGVISRPLFLGAVFAGLILNRLILTRSRRAAEKSKPS
jgi:hypothetical protein